MNLIEHFLEKSYYVDSQILENIQTQTLEIVGDKEENLCLRLLSLRNLLTLFEKSNLL